MNIINKIQRAYNVATDWRFSDRKITLGRTDFSKKQQSSVIAKLDLQTQALTQKTIKEWRIANQAALDIDNPKRLYLLAIYDDAMHDLHLKGDVRNRKMSVVGKPFRVVDKKGNTNPDLTELLQMAWFKKTISLAADSKFYGHSLIEISDPVRTDKLRFTNVRLIPRHHVCPEYGMLLKYPSDWPDKGISYREGDIANFCIEAGEIFDLGELNSVAKETISKKYVLTFWDTFAEIFGMPIRVAKTTSRNPEDQKKIEDMLDKMGSAPWGLFPEGTTIELIANSVRDSYMVYDQRVIRANSEISKAILGQTMTMDDGSSLSQAKVHENVADDVAEMDRDFIKDWVNDVLFPFCIKHGWPLNGYLFDWDDAYEYTPEEMKNIEEMLLAHFDIDPMYFTEKYNIKIIGKKEQQAFNQKEEGPGAGKTTPQKKKLNYNLPEWVLNMPEE